MGRKTFDSIGRPLPNRTNIVITRNTQFKAEGVKVVSNLEEAIEMATAVNDVNGVDEVMVIGGATIYELALPLADRLYLTHVHARIEGDAYFPEIDFSTWHEVQRADYAASENNPYDYSFVVYEK
jgi:dihydrofolate reductase